MRELPPLGAAGWCGFLCECGCGQPCSCGGRLIVRETEVDAHGKAYDKIRGLNWLEYHHELNGSYPLAASHPAPKKLGLKIAPAICGENGCNFALGHFCDHEPQEARDRTQKTVVQFE